MIVIDSSESGRIAENRKNKEMPNIQWTHTGDIASC